MIETIEADKARLKAESAKAKAERLHRDQVDSDHRVAKRRFHDAEQRQSRAKIRVKKAEIELRAANNYLHKQNANYYVRRGELVGISTVAERIRVKS